MIRRGSESDKSEAAVLASSEKRMPFLGGKRTLLSGETESLKTWLALILAKAETDAGYDFRHEVGIHA